MEPQRSYLALGSNLGDRSAYLAFARDQLARLPRSRIIGQSSVEETPPLGGLDQPHYLNQMILLETGLAPRELLTALQAIEQAAGRERRERWGSRTLDIDIVRFGDQTLDEPGLTIPHPELASRGFWQREIEEIDRMAQSG
jgi:2-amino-4-hydroxy-6-hydroxymethyldihydropteridine diphosphokinase